jgi:hypothetical protein
MPEQFDVRAALVYLHDVRKLSNYDLGSLLLTSPSTVVRVRYGRLSGRNIRGRVYILVQALALIQQAAKRPARQ